MLAGFTLSWWDRHDAGWLDLHCPVGIDSVLAGFSLSRWWDQLYAGWIHIVQLKGSTLSWLDWHYPGDGINSVLTGFTLSWWWDQLYAGWIHIVLVMESTLCWLDSHYLNNRINSMLAEVELWRILQKRRVNHQRKKEWRLQNHNQPPLRIYMSHKTTILINSETADDGKGTWQCTLRVCWQDNTHLSECTFKIAWWQRKQLWWWTFRDCWQQSACECSDLQAAVNKKDIKNSMHSDSEAVDNRQDIIFKETVWVVDNKDIREYSDLQAVDNKEDI